jgi:hypothetical protein
MKTITARWAGLFGLMVVLSFPAVAWAQDKEPIPDKFQIDFGGFFVTRADTSVSLAKKAGLFTVGTQIDFHQDLDLPDSDTVPRIDGYYRFGKRSRVDFTYFKIVRSGTATSPNFDINWGDITIPANTPLVSSFLDEEVLKATYGFSFYNQPRAELGVDAGLFIADISAGISCPGGGTGDCAVPNSSQAEVTAPLPVVGAYFRYNISHRWRFIGRADFFFLEFGDYKGSLTDIRLNLEHHTWKHAGFGFGLNGIQTTLDYDTSTESGTLTNTISGPQIYVFTNFGTANYQK